VKCRYCGSELSEDSVFCPLCGGDIHGEVGGAVSYANMPFGTIVDCPRCGAKNSRTERFCVACDTDLEGAKKNLASPAITGPVCPTCGVRGMEDTKYCRRCGASFNPSPKGHAVSMGGIQVFGRPEQLHQHEIIKERQVIMIRCKYCGTLNGPSDRKCSSCGAQM
jgi:uncharacterized membrane protein YvbJ